MLKVASEAVKDLHVAKHDNKYIKSAEGRAVCGNLERAATMVLSVPSAQKLYSKVP